MSNIVELDERINKCLSVLQENSRSRIFAALAEAYRRRGDVGRAFSVCKNGLRIHPDYGAAYVVMAKLYVHQNMIEQARETIRRAIELDGPSRSSDLVLAEIHLEAGEFKNARDILDHLDQVGGSDPTVQTLRSRLSAQSKHPDRTSAPPTVSVQPRRERRIEKAETAEELAPPAGESFCDCPATAVEQILRVPRTILAALWGIDGVLLAARATQARELAPLLEETWTLFSQIEKHVLGRGWGRLSSVRIEEPHGQWGLVQEGKMAALVLGTPQVSYAAAVRQAAGCLRQLAAGDVAVSSTDALLQSDVEHPVE